MATAEVTTVGGLAGHAGSADGTGSIARFASPTGIALGSSGDLFVSDAADHCIRRTVPALADVATIDASNGMVGQQRQLDTSPQTATSWSWQEVRIPSGSAVALSSTSVRNPTFTPDVAGSYAFLLTASDGTSTSFSTVILQVGTASAVVSGAASVCAGASAPIQAALDGVSPWSVTWSDGVTQSGLTSSPATRSVSPDSTTIYTVTAVSDANGSGISSGSASVAVVALPIAVAGGSATIPLGQSTQLSGSGASSCHWAPATGLDNANSCTPQASPTSTTTYSLTVWNTGGCMSGNTARATVDVVAPTRLYTVAPCRLFDTRHTVEPDSAGPALSGSELRTLSIAGRCGLPTMARSLSVNITVVAPSAGGYLTLYRGDLTSLPSNSNINFRAGSTRANNAMLDLAHDGSGTLKVFNGSGGPADLVIDVNGYFQ